MSSNENNDNKQFYTRLTAEKLTSDVHCAQLVQWIKTDLVPTINRMGAQIEVKAAANLHLPAGKSEKNALGAVGATAHPDRVWMEKNYRTIEDLVLKDIEQYTNGN